MADSDFEHSQSPKRRRLNGNTSRSISPDELAASSPREPIYSRRASTNHHDLGEHRRRSYDSNAYSSPDELDHTVHTIYRGRRYQKSSREESVGSADSSIATVTPRRPSTPPRKEQRYLAYRERLVLKGHRKGVAALRFSPDGRMIASCCKHTSIVKSHTQTDALPISG